MMGVEARGGVVVIRGGENEEVEDKEVGEE